MFVSRAKPTIQPDDAIAALEAIHRAMQVSGIIMDKAADEHLSALQYLLRDKFGMERFALKELYLEAEKQRIQLQFVQTMERLFNRVYGYITGEKKSCDDLFREYDAWSAGHAKLDLCLMSESEDEHGDKTIFIEERPYIHTKAITPKAPLLPQVEERIAIETVRAERRLMQGLDKLRQQEVGVTHYTWRTQDDDRVRDSHAALDDQIFGWGDGGEEPGHAHGCRCWAEPTLVGADGIYEPVLDPNAEGTQVAAIQIPLIILEAEAILAAAKATLITVGVIGAGTVAVDQITNNDEDSEAEETSQTESTSPEGEDSENSGDNNQDPDDDDDKKKPFKRPEGVPEDWEEKPSKKKDGTKWVDPNNKHNDVRYQKGNPKSSNPKQQNDYIKQKQNGRWLDKDGNYVPGESPESHISPEDFIFRKGP